MEYPLKRLLSPTETIYLTLTDFNGAFKVTDFSHVELGVFVEWVGVVSRIAN